MKPETVSSRKAIVRACTVVLLLIVCALFIFIIYEFLDVRFDGDLRALQTANAIYATNTAVQNLLNATETAQFVTAAPH